MLQSMLLQRVGPDLATEQQQRNILSHSWCFLNTAFSWFFLSAQWSLFCLLRALLPKYLVLKFPMAHSSVLFPSLLHTHWDRAILSRFRSWTFEFQIYIPRPIETWISNCPFHISTWMSDISNAACPQWNFWCLLLLFGCWVMSDCLQPHGLQQARPPCPSLSPGVCPSSCLLNQWCYPTISSSFPVAFNLSQHQGLFQGVNSCILGKDSQINSFSLIQFCILAALIKALRIQSHAYSLSTC